MSVLLLRIIIKIRWAYFHVSSKYAKFYMDSERTEAHFQNLKTGEIHCNFTVGKKSI